MAGIRLIAAFSVILMFMALPILAQNQQYRGRPEKGYTTKATNLYSEPNTRSAVIEKLVVSQKVEIESTSQDGKFYYVEIDRHGPDINGWVLVQDVRVYEYDHDD
ncbi:MAG: SH3 domain-containing protein [Candidatus Xenobiia bacterium LiM19]